MLRFVFRKQEWIVYNALAAFAEDLFSSEWREVLESTNDFGRCLHPCSEKLLLL